MKTLRRDLKGLQKQNSEKADMSRGMSVISCWLEPAEQRGRAGTVDRPLRPTKEGEDNGSHLSPELLRTRFCMRLFVPFSS